MIITVSDYYRLLGPENQIIVKQVDLVELQLTWWTSASAL